MNANLIIRKMKDAYGVDKDYELAARFGVEPGTVSGWKKRSGGVPIDYIKQAANETGVDVETLTEGGLSMEGPQMPEKILTEMFLQIRGQMDKFDSKLDRLSEVCDVLGSEIEMLKKAMGERVQSRSAKSQKSTDSQRQVGT